jgi:hypothetical protein
VSFSGCKTNQINKDNKEKLIIQYSGLFNKSPDNKFIESVETDIIPKSLGSIFGLTVVSNTNESIDIEIRVYAKKYNEIDEKLLIVNKTIVSSTIYRTKLIEFNEESDFQYEYWIIRAIYDDKNYVERKFYLNDF